VEHDADQPVKEAVPAPSALPATAPDLAPRALSGFAAGMGNQAFNAYIARAPRLVPAGHVIARQPPTKPDPAEVTADERQDGMIQSLIALPIATASGNLSSNPSKTLLKSIRRRVAAARGAFGAFRFPRESKPGQRMLSAQARIDVALALLDGMLSNRPDRLLRAHWGKTLALCKGLSRSLPKPTEAEPEDKRALMRDSVCPAVAAAVADIPAIVAAESSEDMLHLMGNHDTVPDAIFGVAGDKRIAAAVEFKKGIELVKLMARPQEERAAFIAEHLNRASQDVLRINQDFSEDDDLVEPGEEPPPDDPSLAPSPTPAPGATPPDPAPSPNPLPPPPPPPLDPGPPSDAGVAPAPAGVP
jgi:hypothetical protein